MPPNSCSLLRINILLKTLFFPHKGQLRIHAQGMCLVTYKLFWLCTIRFGKCFPLDLRLRGKPTTKAWNMTTGHCKNLQDEIFTETQGRGGKEGAGAHLSCVACAWHVHNMCCAWHVHNMCWCGMQVVAQTERHREWATSTFIPCPQQTQPNLSKGTLNKYLNNTESSLPGAHGL